jgi:hypothetical protein
MQKYELNYHAAALERGRNVETCIVNVLECGVRDVM